MNAPDDWLALPTDFPQAPPDSPYWRDPPEWQPGTPARSKSLSEVLGGKAPAKGPAFTLPSVDWNYRDAADDQRRALRLLIQPSRLPAILKGE